MILIVLLIKINRIIIASITILVVIIFSWTTVIIITILKINQILKKTFNSNSKNNLIISSKLVIVALLKLHMITNHHHVCNLHLYLAIKCCSEMYNLKNKVLQTQRREARVQETLHLFSRDVCSAGTSQLPMFKQQIREAIQTRCRVSCLHNSKSTYVKYLQTRSKSLSRKK